MNNHTADTIQICTIAIILGLFVCVTIPSCAARQERERSITKCIDKPDAPICAQLLEGQPSNE